MAGQQRDVVPPLLKRRHPQRHHAQPVEQIFAKAPRPDLVAEVARGRCDDANVHGDPGFAADALEDLFLQDADDLALGFRRHVGDLVEQQGAVVRRLEGPDLARPGAAVHRPFDPEQLDLHALRRHRRAVQDDEGPGSASRVGMDEAGHHLLAGAGRARDQHPAVGRRHPVDRLPELIDQCRLADQFEAAAGSQPQLLVFPPQPRRLDGAVDDEDHPVGLERLFDEIVGAELDRLHRRLDVAVAAHDHHRHARVVALELLQHLHAVEPAALQPDVEQNETRPAHADGGEGGVAVAGFARLVAFVFQDAGDERADVGLIVDDENVFVHRLRRISHWHAAWQQEKIAGR